MRIIKHIAFKLLLILACTPYYDQVFAQGDVPLSATAIAIEATCPGTGGINVSASGGTTPYLYSITSGPVTRPAQTSNLFTNLQQGTYTVLVTDNNNATYTISNIAVGSHYSAMQPTATAQPQVCPGGNTGSITMSMPSGQGSSPYTYTIESGPTTTGPTTATTSSHTFSNLLPGLYQVRVTDNCGAFQTREATVAAAAEYNLTLQAYTRPSACGTTDYYLRPNLGNNYPQTLYAYVGSTLQQTVVVNAADLVLIPGTSFMGFKFTLPDPATFPGTYYTFKRTDNCVTDVNDPHVLPETPSLGVVNLSVSPNNSCGLNLTAFVGEGWTMPVTVSVTPFGGGTTVSQDITDEAARTTVFSTLNTGSTYVVTFTDKCGKTRTQNAVIQNNLVSDVRVYCSSNIPGTSNADIYGLTAGWNYPVTATITSGPASYYSVFMGKTYTSTYPQTLTSTSDGYIRMGNMAPGTYSITLNDGCNTKTIELVIPVDGATYTVPDEVVSGCAGSRKIVSSSSLICGQSLYADIKRGPGEAVYGNGVQAANGFMLSNVPADTYSIYYYSTFTGRHNLLTIPGEDIYNGNFLVKKSTIRVSDQPTNPTVAGVNSVRCGNGSVALELVSGGSSGAITGYQIRNPDGSFGPLQSSPIFSVSDYGTFEFRLVDECGNANVNVVDVGATPSPGIKTGPNKCLGGDIMLYVELPTGSTAQWTRPDGSQVMGAELLIPNASAGDQGTYTVAVTHSINSCTEVKSSSITLAGCVALPVTLVRFNAVIQEDNVLLSWTTSAEQNNKGFAIERSYDARNWTNIAFINSIVEGGHSSWLLNYTYFDNMPLKGTSYYRLKQVDFNGKYAISQIRSVSFGGNSTNISVSPNPGKSNITLSGLSGYEVVIIYDVNGRKVKELKTNDSTLSIEISNLSEGVYLIKIVAPNGMITTKRIVKIQ